MKTEKRVTVNKTIELLLEIPGNWHVRFGEKGVVRAESPDGRRFALMHSDGRPTAWFTRRNWPEFLTVACPTCKAPVGKDCRAVVSRASTDLHSARREAAEAKRVARARQKQSPAKTPENLT